MHDVALLPIPNTVNIPGVPCPLHVLEPRYRQRVRHCIDENMLMGVCHTEKVLHRNTREQTVEEAGRCMSCGYCFDCEKCWLVCQDEAVNKPIEKGQLYSYKLENCTGCKKCAEECPCGFIAML